MATKSRSAFVTALALAAGSACGQSFTQSFDDITTLVGWDIVNVSMPLGLNNWFQGNLTVFPPQATAGYIGVNFNSAANGPTGDGTQNDWLLLPVTTLNNGDTLSFYTRTVTGGPFPDRLQVRRNSNGNSVNVGLPTVPGDDVGDFTTLLLDINPTLLGGPAYPNDWTQFTVALSGLPASGLSARLAFRYFVTNGGPGGVNGDYIGVDEVVYTASTPAACYPNCDHSTTLPCLNVLDFTCFLNSFAAASTYANCDNSTTPPVLNVNDFICFLNQFAAGCSGC